MRRERVLRGPCVGDVKGRPELEIESGGATIMGNVKLVPPNKTCDASPACGRGFVLRAHRPIGQF